MLVIINYFNPKGIESLRRMAQTSLAFFRDNSIGQHEICLLDGSGANDEPMRCFCAELRAAYLPSASPESFAQTYNRGLELADGNECVICASDIFVPHGWDKFLADYREFRGMIIPYLSCSDYSTQQLASSWARRPIAPVACTINLNYFSRGAVKRIGLLDESFSGSYNDVDLLIRLRRAGMEVLMIDMGPVKHLGKMTVSVATTWDNDADTLTFARKYPHLVSRRWWYTLHDREICRHRGLAVFLRIAQALAPLSLLGKLLIFEIFFDNRRSASAARRWYSGPNVFRTFGRRSRPATEARRMAPAESGRR